MPRAVELRHRTLARQPRSPQCVLAWHPSRPFLRGVLLGAHAIDVRRGRGKYRLDARAGRHNGRGKKPVVGKKVEPAPGNHPYRLGCVHSAQSFLVLTKGNKKWKRNSINSQPWNFGGYSNNDAASKVIVECKGAQICRS